MGKLEIYVKSPNGAVNYLGTAEEVVLEEKNEGSLRRPRYCRSLTLAGEDLGPLSPQKLRRVEIKHKDGLFGSGLAFGVSPAVVHEDGRLAVFTEHGLRVYANTSQYQELFPRDEIRFIDV